MLGTPSLEKNSYIHYNTLYIKNKLCSISILSSESHLLSLLKAFHFYITNFSLYNWNILINILVFYLKKQTKQTKTSSTQQPPSGMASFSAPFHKENHLPELCTIGVSTSLIHSALILKLKCLFSQMYTCSEFKVSNFTRLFKKSEVFWSAFPTYNHFHLFNCFPW